jgi:hypothetical protein
MNYSARISKTESLIEAMEDAVLNLTTGGMSSYTIDTGQTRNTVTKADIGSLNSQLNILYQRLAYFEHMASGGGETIVRPCW